MIDLVRRAWRLQRADPERFRRRVGPWVRSPIRGARYAAEIVRRADRVRRAYEVWLAAPSDPAPTPPDGPLITVLMPVHDPHPAVLQAAIASVRAQTYRRWELCVVDDASTNPAIRRVLQTESAAEPRVRLTFRTAAGHIAGASNDALAMARGEWVVLLDHDDLLSSDALAAVAQAVRPEVDLIYSDEDKLDARGRRVEPFFKPAWSPTLLRSFNYITHLAAVRRSVAVDIGGFRAETSGSQDHDLFLRVTEGGGAVAHIPRVLYHWRQGTASTAGSAAAKPYASAATARALRESLARAGDQATLEPTGLSGVWITRPAPVHGARISAVVVGEGDRWRSALNGRFDLLDLIHLSPDAPAGEALRPLAGDLLLWLAADLQAPPDAVSLLAAYLRDPEVAAVGARTVARRGGRVLQAGLTIGEGGQPLYAYHHLPPVTLRTHFLNTKDAPREVSAVWAGCCLLRRSVWETHSSPHLPSVPAVAGFCLAALQGGFRVLVTPLADFQAARPLPSLPDVTALDWPWRNWEDPYWNPNLNPASGDGLPFCAGGPRPARIRPATMRGR